MNFTYKYDFAAHEMHVCTHTHTHTHTHKHTQKRRERVSVLEKKAAERQKRGGREGGWGLTGQIWLA